MGARCLGPRVLSVGVCHVSRVVPCARALVRARRTRCAIPWTLPEPVDLSDCGAHEARQTHDPAAKRPHLPPRIELGRPTHRRTPESKATNADLTQRVYIIGETRVNSFDRPQVGACQCERALTNVEPRSRILIIPTRFDSPGVPIERACPIRSRNTARTPYSGRLEYATGPLIG